MHAIWVLTIWCATHTLVFFTEYNTSVYRKTT